MTLTLLLKEYMGVHVGIHLHTWEVASSLSLEAPESVIFSKDMGSSLKGAASCMFMKYNKQFSFFVPLKCMQLDFLYLICDTLHLKTKQ